jgi:four helix bundle protein
MNYEDWEKEVPEEIRADLLWKMKAYRLSLFVGDFGWLDVTKLMQDRRTVALSDQLYRSLGSISANLAEGYSHGTGKNRARYYEYSLGSTRESRDWYYKGRHILGESVAQHRLKFLAQIIRLLLTMIPHQRQNMLREGSEVYQIDQSDCDSIDHLLHDIPLP